MYCKHCGNSIDENAAVCIQCGFAKGNGDTFCPNCGKDVQPGAAVCVHCGYALSAAGKVVSGEVGTKSKLTAGLLGIFLGTFGVHNFYLGYTGKAVAQLLITVATCGMGAIVSSIWGLIEGIMILTGSNITTDATGKALAD